MSADQWKGTAITAQRDTRGISRSWTKSILPIDKSESATGSRVSIKPLSYYAENRPRPVEYLDRDQSNQSPEEK